MIDCTGLIMTKVEVVVWILTVLHPADMRADAAKGVFCELLAGI